MKYLSIFIIACLLGGCYTASKPRYYKGVIAGIPHYYPESNDSRVGGSYISQNKSPTTNSRSLTKFKPNTSSTIAYNPSPKPPASKSGARNLRNFFQGFAQGYNATRPKYTSSFTPTDIYSEAKFIPGNASVPSYNWGTSSSKNTSTLSGGTNFFTTSNVDGNYALDQNTKNLWGGLSNWDPSPSNSTESQLIPGARSESLLMPGVPPPVNSPNFRPTPVPLPTLSQLNRPTNPRLIVPKGRITSSRPDPILGGWNHSDGSYSRPDPILGGWNHSDGSSSRPDPILGGWNHSDGSSSRPDPILGGWNHTKP
jgi:hypothetical protein